MCPGCVNFGYLIAEEKETYPGRGEKDGDGAKTDLCCVVRGLLRDIEAIDGHIQRGENTVPPLRPPAMVAVRKRRSVEVTRESRE